MRLAGLGPPVGAGAHRGRNPESRRVHLPVAGVRCSIGIAYQAADAGHPNAGRASSPPSKETSPTGSILTRLHTAKAPIGRASPEESADRTLFQSRQRARQWAWQMGRIGGWSSSKAPVYRAADLLGIMVSCARSSAPRQFARSSQTIRPPAVVFPPSKPGQAAGKREARRQLAAGQKKAEPESAMQKRNTPGNAMHRIAKCQEVHS